MNDLISFYLLGVATVPVLVLAALLVYWSWLSFLGMSRVGTDACSVCSEIGASDLSYRIGQYSPAHVLLLQVRHEFRLRFNRKHRVAWQAWFDGYFFKKVHLERYPSVERKYGTKR